MSFRESPSNQHCTNNHCGNKTFPNGAHVKLQLCSTFFKPSFLQELPGNQKNTYLIQRTNVTFSTIAHTIRYQQAGPRSQRGMGWLNLIAVPVPTSLHVPNRLTTPIILRKRISASDLPEEVPSFFSSRCTTANK